MNIWLINHYAVPPQYYPLARTTCFAKYLDRMGHTVTIFAASSVHNSDRNLIADAAPYRAEIVNGVQYVYVRTRSYQGNGKDRIINMFEFAHRLPGVCRHYDAPDAIVASSATPQACMAGIRMAKRYGCKCVAEITDLWPESFVAYGLLKKRNPLLPLMYAYEKRLYTRADAIIFSMEGGRDYIIEKGWDKAHGGSVDMDKVYHINNGVDLEAFDYNKAHYAFADADLDDPDTFTVVYAGAINRVNNLGALVDAAEALSARPGNRIRILVYGNGNEREALMRRAKQDALAAIVFKGAIDKKYIPFILSKCDLGLMHYGNSIALYRYGVSLNKSFDYMAAGKPILANFTFGYNYISGNGCGVCETFPDAEAYADAIRAFEKMPREDYDAMCRNARKTAEQYDFRMLTEKLIRVMERIAPRVK